MTATLSKAFGSQGGVVLGSRAVIDHVIDSARPFIFDTGLAPMCVAAARASLFEIVNDPDLPARARANAHHLASLAEAIGFEVSSPDAAVVSIVIDDPLDAVARSSKLLYQSNRRPCRGSCRAVPRAHAAVVDDRVEAFARVRGRSDRSDLLARRHPALHVADRLLGGLLGSSTSPRK